MARSSFIRIEDYAPEAFLRDLNRELATGTPIHLWATLPTCAYRCHFCQYPVVVVREAAKAAAWVDLNLREAQRWLTQVPNLARAPVGEFNIFGGTPSLAPHAALGRLLDFYRSHFNFTRDTHVRIEGDPHTLNHATLAYLRQQGCTKVSCGVQSFDDAVIAHTGRPVSSDAGRAFAHNARALHYARSSIDLIYGLLGQDIASVARDLHEFVSLPLSAVVATKLHLRDFAETRTGIAQPMPAAWQTARHHARATKAGLRWPSLGEQYQMRDLITAELGAQGLHEHPTTYFSRAECGPETWKQLMVDQTLQVPEVAIGLGGSSSCRSAEAQSETDPAVYRKRVESGVLPLSSATGFTPQAQEYRSVKMALSSLQPLDDAVHRARFKTSLFSPPWRAFFASLQARGLATVDRRAATVRLTSTGRTLVEAIINTELARTPASAIRAEPLPVTIVDSTHRTPLSR